MEVTVIKNNSIGVETWRYPGQVIARFPDHVLLEAYFDQDDVNYYGLILQRGDRFLETWYFDRWYNIFEIHSCQDDALRGWYCNIGRPAKIDSATISYDDLCLDLIVLPDGQQIVLDEDEFAELEIPPADRQLARQALAELQTQFNQKYQGRI